MGCAYQTRTSVTMHLRPVPAHMQAGAPGPDVEAPLRSIATLPVVGELARQIHPASILRLSPQRLTHIPRRIAGAPRR
jgi:hypothetical protein